MIRKIILTRYFILFSCMLLQPVTDNLKAQILEDSSSLILVKRCVGNIYNLQFEESDKILSEIRTRYPDHPVVPLLKGMKIYWENYPLLPSSPARSLYEEELNHCIYQSERGDEQGIDAEYLLANLCARGLLLLFYSDNGLVSRVIPLTVSSYRYIRQSFDLTEESVDLLYFTGLYNYYREAYPEMHPVYKIAEFLFPPGDEEKGLTELALCADKSVVLYPEARSILSWIWMNFENDYGRSLSYSRIQVKDFPLNPYYKAGLIKNLILLKQYEEAEQLINSSLETVKNNYFNAQMLVMKGILEEKKYGNLNQAGDYYNQGIFELSRFGSYGNDFAAYGYFGLSRLSGMDNDKRGERRNLRKAAELTDFMMVNFNN